MRFEKQVSREVREFLTQQLKEYEQVTKMSKEDRRLLHEWVASGHSPYENGDYIYGAGGPVDFISALRTMQEADEWFDTLSEEEQTAELSSGVQYNTTSDDIIFDIDSINLPPASNEELPF